MAGSRMTIVDDHTTLGGASIDVSARAGWVVRMARVTAAVPDAGLRTVAGRSGTSAARLSRLETGRLRDGRVVDACEVCLALPEGSLRAPIDILCRTFPDASPPDADPGRVIREVPELSRLTERLQRPDPVPGGAWLRWARAMSAPGNVGFPERPLVELIRRLVSELARSVAHGYPTRYEALALLRCSAYGHLVLEVAQAEVGRSYAHGLGDLMSVVGEAVSEDALNWCMDILRHGPEHLSPAGALAIENMGQVAGSGFWEEVAPRLVAAFDATRAGTTNEEWAAHLIRLVPPGAWKSRHLVPARPLPSQQQVPSSSPDQAERRWRDCLEAARVIGVEAGVGAQPMLARLVHDIAYGPWETRAATSSLLLGAVPALAQRAAAHVARFVEEASDPPVRQRAARRLVGLLDGQHLPAVERWLDADDAALRRTALAVAGAAGRHVPADVLHASLRDPQTRRRAIGAAGLAAHPALAEVAGSSDLPADVRTAARWWLDHGGRVVE